jgi:nucleoside-diphosphate-sugar epimerase
MSRHLAVFGGGRMIGPPLLRAAIARGWRVTVVNRQSPPPPELGEVGHVAGDRGDRETLARVADLAADVVIDLSCYEPAHVELALRALAGRVGRYVMMSSAAVYRPGDLLPWPESHPLGGDPLWGSYGEKKLRNERIAEGFVHRVQIAVLRAPYIVGHPDFMNRLQFIADRIAFDPVVYVSGSGQSPIQLASPSDVAEALVHLCDVELDAPQAVAPFNIGNAKYSSLDGLVRLLAEAMEREHPAIVPVALGEVGLTNAPFSWTDMVFPFADRPYLLDDAKLRSTGFRPAFDLDRLLGDFVARYADAGGPVPPRRYPAEIKAQSFPSIRFAEGA